MKWGKKTHTWIRCFVFVLMILGLSFIGLSQSNDEYVFETINNSNGLSADNITDIYQDSQGFLWIATTDGLNRYDGYTFKIFKPDYNKEVTFTSNYFTVIAEDNQGRLWIGTNRNGINIYNKFTGDVSVISTNTDDVKLPDDAISSLYIDDQDNKWIGTYNYGILRLDSTNRLTVYRTKSNHLSSVSNVRVLYEDSHNRLWMGTWNNGLFYYDNQHDDFVHVELPWPHPIDNKNIQSIGEDQQGRILIGTWGHGLFRLDSINQITQNIEHYSYLNQSVSKKLNDNEIGNLIYSIETDRHGKTWLATNDGILIFEGENIKEPLKIKANPKSVHAPNHSQIYSLLLDREGIMWLGTQGAGLHSVNPDRNEFKLHKIDFSTSELIRESSVYSFVELDDEKLLVGVKTEGFLCYNKTTSQYSSYRDIDGFKELPNINLIYAFHKDQFGRIWLGTRYKGGYVVDLKEGSHIHLNNYFQDFYCRAVYCFMRDVDNNLWIGTDYGLYILKYLENTDKQYHLFRFVYSKSDTTSLSGNYITSIYQDSNGDVWLGTMNSGLNCYRDNFVNEEMKFQRYKPKLESQQSLRSNIINDICEDRRGNLWIGTNGGGLVRFNPVNDNFTRYGKREGIITNNVVTILESPDSNIWIGTDRGIFKSYLTKKGKYQFTNYTVKDGLQDRIFIRGAKYKSIYDSTLYFGGYYGFNSFNPNQIDFHSLPPKLAFTELRFNSQDKCIDPGSKDPIEVPHHVKTISIEFSSLSFKNPDQNQYAFILDGYNDDWQYRDAAYRKAVFTNLPRGDYTLKVKATNSNGMWSKELISLNFAVKPSPYASTFALIIYGVVLFGVIYFIVNIVINRIEIKHELKIEEQLRIKEEKQHQSKLQLLTDISHEFLTPLSIISCVIDDFSAKENFYGESFQVVKRNIFMLKDLVNQFLLVRKSQAKMLRLNVSNSNMNEFLNEIYKFFHPLAKNKNLQFDMIISQDLEMGYFDRGKLTTILHNIIFNAFKYTEKGGVYINVQDYFIEGCKYAQISVEDTGKGIPEDKFDEIFMRFKQVEQHNTTGIGIGLELTKSLVELHKGSISVKSKLQEGSSFIINFPIDIEAYAEDEIMNNQNKEETFVMFDKKPVLLNTKETRFFDPDDLNDGHNINDKMILLVEDDGELRNLLSRYLLKFYNVKAISTCEEAINVAKKTIPDLIVSDIMMPGVDGYELTRQIKNDLKTSHIPVILLTAKIDDESKIKGYDFGADSYITKPVNLKLLYTRIESLFQAWEELRNYYSGNKRDFEPDTSKVNLTSMDKQYIKRALEIIEIHLTDSDFNVQSLVMEMGTSSSMLYRKFNKIIGINPNEYIKNSRLKMAARMLYDNNYNISEVAYLSGFNDLSYFGKCFKKYTGKSPTEYKN